MKVEIFVIRDSASNSFGIPQFSPAKGVFLRQIGDMVNSGEKSPLSTHPEDFEIFSIGHYDDNTAEVKWSSPVSVMRVKDLIAPKN